MIKRKRSIVYLNFAPYENAGRILDWLIETYDLVVLFSFDFHKLNDKSQSNTIKIWQKSQQIDEIKLYQLPSSEALLFITLPLIIILIGIQTLWQMVRLRRLYGQFNTYLTVNAFTAWLGNILRAWGIVDKTIFWVWDYYPPGYPDWKIRLARWGYWQFDRWSSTASSQVIFLNERLLKLRQDIDVIDKKRAYSIIPIGANPGQPITQVQSFAERRLQPIIGHIGVLKRSQGLDLLFDQLSQLIKAIPTIKIEIIGSGPDLPYFRTRAKGYKNVRFFGFIKEENKVDEIIRRWMAGISTYIPDTSNPAYWTDPSKIKAYISQSVPVITTNISPFAKEVQAARAGVVIDYFEPDALTKAAVKIYKNPSFRNRAYNLAKKYEYRKIYTQAFD